MDTKDEDPTDLLNEGFRYRDLDTGVFLSRDPAGFVDGPNVYTYVQQNPWTKNDPDGLFWHIAAAAFISDERVPANQAAQDRETDPAEGGETMAVNYRLLTLFCGASVQLQSMRRKMGGLRPGNSSGESSPPRKHGSAPDTRYRNTFNAPPRLPQTSSGGMANTIGWLVRSFLFLARPRLPLSVDSQNLKRNLRSSQQRGLRRMPQD